MTDERRSAWVGILAFSLFAWTVSNLDQSLFGYAIPGIIGEFNIGLDRIGLILSIGFIVSAVMVVFAGLAADTWGRRWTLAILLASSAFFVGMHGFVNDASQLTVRAPRSRSDSRRAWPRRSPRPMLPNLRPHGIAEC
jgi:MFS family permease